MRLAVIKKEKCRPALCAHECKKFCPVEKKEKDSCVNIKQSAGIDETTCIGCSICAKRCPFDAIKIINLPTIDESQITHRYGKNSFALYGLPAPREKTILGFLGQNGIGKSTAVRILAGKESPNFGKENPTKEDFKNFFKGSEIIRYFESLKNKKIAYKPQNISELRTELIARDLLEKCGKKEEIEFLAKKLGVEKVLDNKLKNLSGGELQKIAIIAASVKNSDIYFFDEPLAFLDIGERIRISDFIKEKSNERTTIVVEHDLLILDYLTDYISIFYGSPGAYGMASVAKPSKNAVNSYLEGFLKEENVRIREKSLSFNFTKNAQLSGTKITEWPAFKLEFESGFKLQAEKGEIYENNCIGILGQNGVGKTSFVRALAGELEVSIKDNRKKLDLKLKISYKPQHIIKKNDEKVKDIIIREKIPRKTILAFRLGALESKKISELSGGELQRLEIARCISKEADLYLIDEPSAFLDVEERISAAKAIKDKMIEKGKTAFIVDHDLLLISYVADSIINFIGTPQKEALAKEPCEFSKGISTLLKSLNITLRKDKESGRPRINKKGSVLDREQKAREEWVIL
ncbi:ribosome biogenesis/translation initiation ATPase RLI [Candidatus Pacearchaeota archaeon]|nr:MAG: ribosome biogenesis/translation initiation ATPase RLI [Candidatus Pacearchaeota archaeon]